MAVARSKACVILELNSVPVVDWRAGPLPVEGLTTARATADRRATYFAPRAAQALYGQVQTSGPSRSALPGRGSACRNRIPEYCPRVHCADTRAVGPDVLGAELLTLPPFVASDTSFLVIHIDLGADPIESLSRWVITDRSNAPLRMAAMTLLGDQVTLAPTTRRARSVALVTFDGPVTDTYQLPALTPEEGWLWVLASATPLTRFPLDVSDRRMFKDMIHLSASWRALVLRDGVGFVGLQPDAPHSFFVDAEQYVRSVYLDAFLLALLQRHVLDSFANTLSRFDDRYRSGAELRRLETQLTYFRNTLWWRQITQSGPAQDILRAAQRQHGVEELFHDVVADISDFSRQVQSEIDFRTNTALRLLAVWGLPVGTALAAAPVATGRHGPVPLLLTVLIGLLLGTILHFTVGRMIDPNRAGPRIPPE